MVGIIMGLGLLIGSKVFKIDRVLVRVGVKLRKGVGVPECAGARVENGPGVSERTGSKVAIGVRMTGTVEQPVNKAMITSMRNRRWVTDIGILLLVLIHYGLNHELEELPHANGHQANRGRCLNHNHFAAPSRIRGSFPVQSRDAGLYRQ